MVFRRRFREIDTKSIKMKIKIQIKNLPLDFIKLQPPSEGIENQKLSTFCWF